MKNTHLVLHTLFSIGMYVCSPLHASDKQIQKYTFNSYNSNLSTDYATQRSNSLYPIDLSAPIPQPLVTVDASILGKLMPGVLVTLAESKRFTEGLLKNHAHVALTSELVVQKKQYLENLNKINYDSSKIKEIGSLLLKNELIVTLPAADYKLFLQYATYNTELESKGTY